MGDENRTMNHSRRKTPARRDLPGGRSPPSRPGPCLFARCEDESRPSRRIWLIALGKAAEPMAEAAVRVSPNRASRAALLPAGSSSLRSPRPRPHPSIAVIAGDHPEPGAGSLAAADALDRLVKTIPPGDTVWVLLSGGTTSLIGAPQPGIAAPELKALYAQLLRSGLDIKEMNRVRKRFTRWGGGRLARSLAHARVRCYIVSDVIGDDLAAIASGPWSPIRPRRAMSARRSCARASGTGWCPRCRRHLDESSGAASLKRQNPATRSSSRVETRLIATNRLALEAAGRRARGAGLVAEIVESPLIGEARNGRRAHRRTACRGRPRGSNYPAA